MDKITLFCEMKNDGCYNELGDVSKYNLVVCTRKDFRGHIVPIGVFYLDISFDMPTKKDFMIFMINLSFEVLSIFLIWNLIICRLTGFQSMTIGNAVALLVCLFIYDFDFGVLFEEMDKE